MAQHSHSVYGNIYPAHQYYQKNKSYLHNVNLKSFRSNQTQSQSVRFPALSALPFLNRNVKLHKSNPHLHFGGCPNENQNHKINKNLNTKCTKANNKPSQSKWKNDASNSFSTPSMFHRKLCDFVLRRNEDNKVYRSESFRFIQKTDSFQILPHLSVGLNKYRKKQLQVPVSDNYLEPLDQVIQTSGSEGLNNSQPVKTKLAGEPQEDDNCEDSPYNAPYYYSDTIKEPTYSSPCPSWRQSCGDLRSKLTLPSQEDRERIARQQKKLSRSSRFRDRSIGEASMARKRYETAFISSSSHHPTQSTSPDVDSLLLAIESSCSFVHRSDNEHNFRTTPTNNEGNRVGVKESITSDRNKPELNIDCNQVRQDPSISYCQSANHSHSINHTSGSTTTNSSPLSDKKSKPTMPLSEPLPQKKYSNIPSSSYSSSGPSTATSLTSCRPSDKRILMTMVKDNSVSSLESIDSTKSDDLQSFSQFAGHRGGSHHGHFGRQGANCKLLSPISDKSPLESGSIMQSSVDGNEVHGQSSSNHFHHHHHQNHLISAAELTNVPWDMPKLKRRLALLADSGISLDCPGSSHGESGHYTIGGDHHHHHHRDSCEESSNQEYTINSSHIRGNLDLRLAQPQSKDSTVVYSKQDMNRQHHHHSLHLSFDNGLVQDEYYEDPRLEGNNQSCSETAYSNHNWDKTTGPPNVGSTGNITSNLSNRPKTLSNWVKNVTSVQVHVSGSEGQKVGIGKPDRCRMKLDFAGSMINNPITRYEIDPTIELEAQEWFHGAITRSEAESILRATKEGSFLVRNCESSSFNRYSLSLKSARGFIHIRIEPNSLGTFSLGEQEFHSVPHLVLHFMCHRLPIKGAEHVKLLYPVITQLL